MSDLLEYLPNVLLVLLFAATFISIFGPGKRNR